MTEPKMHVKIAAVDLVCLNAIRRAADRIVIVGKREPWWAPWMPLFVGFGMLGTIAAMGLLGGWWLGYL